MLNLLIGFIIGILTAILVAVILTYFHRVIEHKTIMVEKYIENAGPKPKGFIIEPDDEAEEARQRIIERNKRAGRDTPLADLL